MAQPGWVGQKLGGRYEILEPLGQGGMSAVYKAMDPNLRRVVAVKIIHPHLSSDPEFVRRFEKEAAAVAQLRHPNIIQVFDFNHDEGAYYIVFEFIPGETLQARLKRLNETGRQMPVEEAIKISEDVGGALAYAAARGLVHRDVKPANIMLNVHGAAIIMDFGIVKIVGGTQHTATGAVLGTARYMSPEQIKGGRVDERSDVYSLGVTLFEMLGGRAPYEADSAMTVMMMHVQDPIPDVRDLRPMTPAALSQVVHRMLEKEPDRRYASTAEMVAALERLKQPETAATPAREETTTAVTPPALTTIATPPPPPATSTGSQQPSDKRPLPWKLIGGIASGVLLLLLALAVIVPRLGGATPAPTEAGLTSTSAAAAVVDTATMAATAVATAASTQPADTPTTAPSRAAAAVTNPTHTPSPTRTVPPTAPPPPPTHTPPTAPPTHTPPTIPPTPPPPTETTAPPPTAVQLRAQITGIQVEGDQYVVDYTTTGFTEQVPGQHVHFFFNTVPPEQAGVPGSGPWILYGGPRPFRGYTVNDRPGGATQMCILVANPDHSIQLNSGNCVNLP